MSASWPLKFHYFPSLWGEVTLALSPIAGHWIKTHLACTKICFIIGSTNLNRKDLSDRARKASLNLGSEDGEEDGPMSYSVTKVHCSIIFHGSSGWLCSAGSFCSMWFWQWHSHLGAYLVGMVPWELMLSEPVSFFFFLFVILCTILLQLSLKCST